MTTIQSTSGSVSDSRAPPNGNYKTYIRLVRCIVKPPDSGHFQETTQCARSVENDINKKYVMAVLPIITSKLLGMTTICL